MIDFQEPERLVDSIARSIGEAIWSGRLAPGTRLIEEQLCKELGVSRTPLREALRILAGKGLIDVQARRGARVMQLTRKSVADLYAIRGALEGLAANLAAQYATAEEVRILRQQAERMRRAVGEQDREAYFDANQAFHAGVADASDNPRLRQLLDDWPVQIYRLLFSDSYLAESPVGLYLETHEEVIDAIEARDGEAAERLMRRHANDSRDEAMRHMRTHSFPEEGEQGRPAREVTARR